MTKQEIDSIVSNNVYTNNQGLITGIVLQQVLLEMNDFANFQINYSGAGSYITNIQKTGNALNITRGGAAPSAWGETADNYASLTVNGISKNVALSGHTHSISDIVDLSTQLNNKLDKVIFEDLFEKVEISTDVYAIKAKYDFFGVGEVAAYGFGSGSGGGGGSFVAWSNKSNNYIDLTVEGITERVALSGHTHNYIPLAQKGASGGIAELDSSGHVPASQLPSYVDDVLEYSNQAAFPTPGESGKIYVALDTNLTYRWSGSGYVEISPSLALGETSSTAYRGDRGKTAYDHSQVTGNPHNTTKSQVGLGNVLNVASYSKGESDTALASKLNKSVFDDLFEKVEVSTGVYAIKAKYDFFGVGEVAAYGFGTGGTGPGGSYVEWGSTSNNYSPLIVEGVSKTVALSGHTHPFTEITGTATAAQIPNLNASKITAGVFPTARLGTGTGTSANFLRGDGSWAAVTSANNGQLTLSTGTGLTGSATFTANQSGNSTFSVGIASTHTLPTNAQVTNWNTAYGWGNHASAGYALVTHTHDRLRQVGSSVDSLDSFATDYTLRFNQNISSTSPNLFPATNNANALLSISSHQGNYDHQLGFSANGNIYHRYRNNTVGFSSWSSLVDSTRSISAGTGLTGGGTLSANRTLALDTTYADNRYVTRTTDQTITGAKTFTGNVLIKGAAADSPLRVRGIDGYIDSTGLLDNLYLNFVSTKDIIMAMGGGNVGIGTTSPSYKLDVAGDSRFTGNVTGGIVTNDGIEYLRRLSTNISATGWYRVFVSNSHNAHGASVILNVNRQYASTNNESYTFAINVAYSGAISITQLSGIANYRIISKIRVDRVNIGVLAVDIYYNLNVTNAVRISGSGTGKFQAPALVASPSGTTVEFDTVNGVKTNLNFVASGEVTAHQSSDIRLKTNIQPLVNSLDLITKLNPVSFNWNDDMYNLNPTKTKGKDYGLIAQEVQSILPDIVHTIYDKYLGLDYDKLIPHLIGAVKELKKEIEQLKAN